MREKKSLKSGEIGEVDREGKGRGRGGRRGKRIGRRRSKKSG